MRRIVAVGLVLLVGCLGVPGVGAQAAEGIRVHGYWKIEILEPDGSLVSSYEFENGFVGSGLLDMLTSASSIGIWSIVLQTPGGPGSVEPCSDSGGDIRCIITEATSSGIGTNIFKNLTTTTTPTLVLSGTATAANATTVGIVMTTLGSCLGTVGPASCTAGESNLTSYGDFTFTGLATPQAVAPGQLIQVTVTIVFS